MHMFARPPQETIIHELLNQFEAMPQHLKYDNYSSTCDQYVLRIRYSFRFNDVVAWLKEMISAQLFPTTAVIDALIEKFTYDIPLAVAVYDFAIDEGIASNFTRSLISDAKSRTANITRMK